MHDLADSKLMTRQGSQPLRPQSNRTAPQGQVAQRDNAQLLDELYTEWKVNPKNIDPTWASFFEGFELGCQQLQDASLQKGAPISGDKVSGLKQAFVYNLIFAYRAMGHLKADLDPLKLDQRTCTDLELSKFQLKEADLDQTFDSGTLANGGERRLRDIVEILEQTYCSTIGVEYMHIQDSTMRNWLCEKMESCRNTPSFSREKKARILNRLQQAELFEKFLHTRYVGQKRFSLEGGDTLIPMLDALIENSSSMGSEEFFMGMAHRGRLNVLTNIMGEKQRKLFAKFEETYVPTQPFGSGDVKYHMGAETTVSSSSGQKVRLSLAYNPSHLEAVNPVVEGQVRARQHQLKDESRTKAIPVLIHGDAAFIAQGVVAETLNLCQLQGYTTGGTLHIVINNQIGFTTSPNDARSTTYCTDLAQMLQVPIFHVNGDYPEQAVYLMELAFEFRQQFKKDVVIDLVCYRKHGHNEGDEPAFTQPILYSTISHKPTVATTYAKNLVAENSITQQEVDAYQTKFNEMLQNEMNEAKGILEKAKNFPKPVSTPEVLNVVETALPLEKLHKIGSTLGTEPTSIKVNPKVAALLKSRMAMAEGKEKTDWGFAEGLAFGSLLLEGKDIRLSGQDCRRGTFSHRHAVLYDMNNRNRYVPLDELGAKGRFSVYNSPLSEEAVLGFDYGYSLTHSEGLVLWEGQFGDFVNGAQNIIDQYITSCESKWGTTSRLVLLLPHGYHGQGPEHSSARLERFLQACAEDNIQVANCSSPASYFHLLRKQALQSSKKPLIIMTPKGLLRDKRAASSIEEMSRGHFQEVIPDSQAAATAERVILCSGKVYYDLVDHLKTLPHPEKVAIIRLEQLYPLHEKALEKAVKTYSKAKAFVWCQEEPENMGSWSFIEPRLRKLFGHDFAYAGRSASASPSTGYASVHDMEQKKLINEAFNATA